MEETPEFETAITSKSRAVLSTSEKLATPKTDLMRPTTVGWIDVVFKRQEKPRRKATYFFYAKIFDRSKQVSFQQLGEIWTVALFERDLVVADQH